MDAEAYAALEARVGPGAAQKALAQAEGDRALLARLRASGSVLRDASVGRNVPGARRFAEDIERRAFPVRGMDTIRPNKKRRKK